MSARAPQCTVALVVQQFSLSICGTRLQCQQLAGIPVLALLIDESCQGDRVGGRGTMLWSIQSH